MAQFGAKYIKFNPIKEQPENALPLYENKDPVQLGALVKANLTVNMASGEIYGDDELAENLEEFSSGDLAVETVDMLDEVASVVYGCEAKDKEVTYKYGDAPPEGGLAYYKVLLRQGVKSFKGFFYPRVKAALGNDSAETRNGSISFRTTATKFKVFSCKSGAWRKTFECATEAEARAWVDEKLGKAPAPASPGTPDTEESGKDESGGVAG